MTHRARGAADRVGLPAADNGCIDETRLRQRPLVCIEVWSDAKKQGGCDGPAKSNLIEDSRDAPPSAAVPQLILGYLPAIRVIQNPRSFQMPMRLAMRRARTVTFRRKRSSEQQR